jgi:hypothetical protein
MLSIASPKDGRTLRIFRCECEKLTSAELNCPARPMPMARRRLANHIRYRRCTLGARFMADALDEDVQALRNWLRDAWRFLANNPSLTPYNRRELRNSMKLVEATLRAGIAQVAVEEKARRGSLPPSSDRTLMPRFRVLKDTPDAAA